MEEKKTSASPADTNPQVDLMDKEPIAAAVEATPEPVAANTTAKTSKRSVKLTIVTIIVVAVALAGFVYLLEKNGRINSTIFSGMIAAQEEKAAVAMVNGVDVTGSQLDQTMQQLAQAAAQQGMNPADPEVQALVRSQSIDMLIGTELLMQQAKTDGIEVSEEEIITRLAEIEEAAGGAEALAASMDQFNISQATLEDDVRSELLIGKLLEGVLTEADMSVSEEELTTAYEGSGGEEAGLPPYDEVKSQIESQIAQAKEQAAVESYVSELRANADIEIVE